MEDGYRSQLDFFNASTKDISVVKSEHTAYYPLVSLQDSVAPVEFNIKSNPGVYLDLKSSYLYAKIKITKKRRWVN